MPITLKINAEDLDPEALEECIRVANECGMIGDDGSVLKRRREFEDAYEALLNGDIVRAKRLLGDALFPNGGNIIFARVSARLKQAAAARVSATRTLGVS